MMFMYPLKEPTYNMSYFLYILALILIGYSVQSLVSEARRDGLDSGRQISEKELQEAWSDGFTRGVKSVG